MIGSDFSADALPEADYPRTVAECREQGRADRRAGYPATWTPNLGPLTRSRFAWLAWQSGWHEEDRLLLQRFAEVGLG